MFLLVLVHAHISNDYYKLIILTIALNNMALLKERAKDLSTPLAS